MPQPADNRLKRREAIIDILSSQTVSKQIEFVDLLQKKGFEATQSSVSRDLRELGISKLAEGYEQIETNTDLETMGIKFTTTASDFIRDIKTAGNNLTIVHTAIGAAQRVAVFLDRSNWPEIAGTVSGDDTIFIATRNKQDQLKLIIHLQATLKDN